MSQNQPFESQELLIKGFKLFRTGFREILGILLSQTLSLIVLAVVLFSITMLFYGSHTGGSLPTAFLISLVSSILIVLMVQLGFIASFTTKFWAIAHQRHISSSQAYHLGIRKALPLLIWVIIYLTVVAAGLLFFIVPGLILAVTLFMGAALVIQDHYPPMAAFKASYKMVRPHARQTLFYLFITTAITLLLYFLTLYPLGLFVSYLTSNYPILNGIFDIVRYTLIVMLVPLFVALVIPFYMEQLELVKGHKERLSQT